MFNLSGTELIFLVLIALVVLGPDKLPEAMRKAGKAYADFKKMTMGFQSEMRSVLDEPMRELRETAELAKKSAMFDVNGMTGNSAEKPVSASMEAHTPPKQESKPEPKLAPASPIDATSVDPRISVAEPEPPLQPEPEPADAHHNEQHDEQHDDRVDPSTAGGVPA